MNISAWLPGTSTCSITEPFRGLSSCLRVLFTLAVMQICCDSVNKVQTTLRGVACRDSLQPHLQDQHSLIADSHLHLETEVFLQFSFWEIAPEPLLHQPGKRHPPPIGLSPFCSSCESTACASSFGVGNVVVPVLISTIMLFIHKRGVYYKCMGILKKKAQLFIEILRHGFHVN